MARLYHPELGREYECPDDEDLIAVLAESGWEPAPERKAIPGHEPEPVTYEPAAASKPRGRGKTTKSD